MKNYKLIEILNFIVNSPNTDFTGLGLIIYKKEINLPIEPLKKNCILDYKLTDTKIIGDKLKSISCKNNNCHDGFHLLNEDIELTALSYYFSTPISNEVKPKKEKGSRYRTAFYGSLINGVICTVSINSNFEVYIFINGEEFTLDEYRML